jgi:hypothetical protein
MDFQCMLASKKMHTAAAAANFPFSCFLICVVNVRRMLSLNRCGDADAFRELKRAPSSLMETLISVEIKSCRKDFRVRNKQNNTQIKRELFQAEDELRKFLAPKERFLYAPENLGKIKGISQKCSHTHTHKMSSGK